MSRWSFVLQNDVSQNFVLPKNLWINLQPNQTGKGRILSYWNAPSIYVAYSTSNNIIVYAHALFSPSPERGGDIARQSVSEVGFTVPVAKVAKMIIFYNRLSKMWEIRMPGGGNLARSARYKKRDRALRSAHAQYYYTRSLVLDPPYRKKLSPPTRWDPSFRREHTSVYVDLSWPKRRTMLHSILYPYPYVSWIVLFGFQICESPAYLFLIITTLHVFLANTFAQQIVSTIF